jgi:hypothetical protein
MLVDAGELLGWGLDGTFDLVHVGDRHEDFAGEVAVVEAELFVCVVFDGVFLEKVLGLLYGAGADEDLVVDELVSGVVGCEQTGLWNDVGDVAADEAIHVVVERLALGRRRRRVTVVHVAVAVVVVRVGCGACGCVLLCKCFFLASFFFYTVARLLHSGTTFAQWHDFCTVAVYCRRVRIEKASKRYCRRGHYIRRVAAHSLCVTMLFAQKCLFFQQILSYLKHE